MATEAGVLTFQQQLGSSTTVQEVLAQLQVIDASFKRGDLSRADVLSLRSSAFRTLREITQDDPATAERLILQHMVPDLVSDVMWDASSEARSALSRYYEYLATWVDQYPIAQRTAIRSKVLDALAPALASPRPESACWAIARLGYRSPDLTESLWRLVARANDETGGPCRSGVRSAEQLIPQASRYFGRYGSNPSRLVRSTLCGPGRCKR